MLATKKLLHIVGFRFVDKTTGEAFTIAHNPVLKDYTEYYVSFEDGYMIDNVPV